MSLRVWCTDWPDGNFLCALAAGIWLSDGKICQRKYMGKALSVVTMLPSMLSVFFWRRHWYSCDVRWSTVVIQDRGAGLCWCFLLLFLLLVINQAKKASSKQIKPYFYYNLQQEAVLVLRSGHIPVTFIFNRIKVTTFFHFFLQKPIHMFFIPLKHRCSLVNVKSFWDALKKSSLEWKSVVTSKHTQRRTTTGGSRRKRTLCCTYLHRKCYIFVNKLCLQSCQGEGK